MRCPTNSRQKIVALARCEALARKIDEFQPGYYDSLLEAYRIRKLEMLSGCELAGLVDTLSEDFMKFENPAPITDTTHYEAMEEAIS